MNRIGTEITSPHNLKIKETARLRQERHRKKAKRILVDGVREVLRACRAGWELESLFVVSNEDVSVFPDELWSAVDAERLYTVAESVFEKIAFGNRNEGVVAVFKESNLSLSQLQLGKNPLLLILDGIEKPGNIGAVFRTAAAAGVDAIILTNEVSSPFNANAIRSSLGTIFELPFVTSEVSGLIGFLGEREIEVVTTQVDAELDYTEIDLTKAVAVVLGSEATGIAAEWKKFRTITIPMQRSVDSLNISATAAIVAFEARRQRSL